MTHLILILIGTWRLCAGDEGCTVANADNSCRLDRVADSLIANFDAILACGP